MHLTTGTFNYVVKDPSQIRPKPSALDQGRRQSSTRRLCPRTCMSWCLIRFVLRLSRLVYSLAASCVPDRVAFALDCLAATSQEYRVFACLSSRSSLYC